jgi:hypothetical protein
METWLWVVNALLWVLSLILVVFGIRLIVTEFVLFFELIELFLRNRAKRSKVKVPQGLEVKRSKAKVLPRLEESGHQLRAATAAACFALAGFLTSISAILIALYYRR